MDEASQTGSAAPESQPTECAECGTALESAAVDLLLPTKAEAADHPGGAVVFQDFCPNPDCPLKGTSTT